MNAAKLRNTRHILLLLFQQTVVVVFISTIMLFVPEKMFPANLLTFGVFSEY